MVPQLPQAVNDFVSDLVRSGPDVVWLAGSFARGEQAKYSDIDLGVLASRPAPLLRTVISGRLVAVSTTTEELTRRSFTDPRTAGAAVPGWRRAVFLHDASGAGARLQHEAIEWAWECVPGIDEWVGQELAVLAEDVLKLCNGLERHDIPEAALRRNDVANRALRLAAVQERVLYDSESRLIAAVCEARGSAWRRTVRVALAVEQVANLESMKAACALFEDLVGAADGRLSPQQRAVVQLSVAAVRHIWS